MCIVRYSLHIGESVIYFSVLSIVFQSRELKDALTKKKVVKLNVTKLKEKINAYIDFADNSKLII